MRIGGDETLASTIPNTMSAVLLTGYGGLEKLEFRTDVPVPVPNAEEVLIRIGAAGVNNTDINTRLGWYAKSVETATTETHDDAVRDRDTKQSAWAGQSLTFPRIQGLDVCGTIVAVGGDVPASRIGERVLVVPMQRSPMPEHSLAMWTLGADGDGGFAQYTKTRSIETFAIESRYTDVELASFPCAYSTAENLLHHAGVMAGETVLITGASGGVGTAAVQLARRRGAHVLAVASAGKADAMLALGAEPVIPRGEPLGDHLSPESVDVVIDVVAGPQFGELLDVLRRCGRYAAAGAIAGPMVELDMRTLYLKDLTLLGRTLQERSVFRSLVGYIEREEIVPVVAKHYPLREIRQAQTDFMAKEFIGKLVLVPEP